MTDEERDHLRALLAPIVEREAERMHAGYLKDLSFTVITWGDTSNREQWHWRSVAWTVIAREINAPGWQPSAER